MTLLSERRRSQTNQAQTEQNFRHSFPPVWMWSEWHSSCLAKGITVGHLKLQDYDNGLPQTLIFMGEQEGADSSIEYSFYRTDISQSFT